MDLGDGRDDVGWVAGELADADLLIGERRQPHGPGDGLPTRQPHPPATFQIALCKDARVGGDGRRQMAEWEHERRVDLVRELQAVLVARIVRVVLAAGRAWLEVDEPAPVDRPGGWELAEPGERLQVILGEDRERADGLAEPVARA